MKTTNGQIILKYDEGTVSKEKLLGLEIMLNDEIATELFRRFGIAPRFHVNANKVNLEEIPPNAIVMNRATPIETKDGVMLSMPDVLRGITGRLIFIPEGERCLFTDVQVQNLECFMNQNFPDAKDRYIAEIRYSPKSDEYYVLMRKEDRRGIAEFCLKLDFGATAAPSAEEIIKPFHANDFPELKFFYEL